MCTKILGRSRVYPWVVEKPALVPNAFKRGGGLPRAYLAVKLESRYTKECSQAEHAGHGGRVDSQDPAMDKGLHLKSTERILRRWKGSMRSDRNYCLCGSTVQLLIRVPYSTVFPVQSLLHRQSSFAFLQSTLFHHPPYLLKLSHPKFTRI